MPRSRMTDRRDCGRARRALLPLLTLLASFSPTASALSAAELRGRVLDADSGQPLAARVYVEDAHGQPFFPSSADQHGTAVRYDVVRAPGSQERHVTLSAHAFIVDVPAGHYTLVAEHGKEWTAARAEIDVTEQPAAVELRLSRWINLPARGFYSGDTHVHRRLEDMDNLVLAEDLNVALPLTNWVQAAYAPPIDGQLRAPEHPGLVTVDPTHVYWTMNTEYELFTLNGRPHTLGAVFVLNHQTPLRLGAPPVGPIAEEARRQHALLDLDKHTWNWSVMAAFAMPVDLFELANNHVWRTEFLFKDWTIDQLPHDWGIETDGNGFTEWGWVDWGFKTYYAFLNCGLPMRPTAGTGAGVHPVPLGYGRVYVHLDGDFSYEKWIAGLTAGNSFVTTGPLLDVTFDRQPPGTRLKSEQPCRVTVSGVAESLWPLEQIEIVVNGELHPVPPGNATRSAGGYSSDINRGIDIAGSSWIAVRCVERLPDGRFRYAHSAPAYVDIPGRPLHPRALEVDYFIERIQSEIKRNSQVLADDELAEYRHVLEHLENLRADAVH